ncbi:uncharacterized protein BO72DRAFT_20015 [Aspergillus fijiensis CBS 313.89]|uniref:Uncharacterized protein n=1 Tax=Aspergillus fijiensis CBS 313.89 TaxID=1448319 RepID=A0A8G1REH9_9EURO|nr:uncharacterized protein BO72DRAFT_20015 [Aspergillus fijiensis CBS 313.89]RAK71293.1 hypothetical protein BO72DRAFT_20015 [Aspergillus fijiensis CBS 313.89]
MLFKVRSFDVLLLALLSMFKLLLTLITVEGLDCSKMYMTSLINYVPCSAQDARIAVVDTTKGNNKTLRQ